MRWGVENRVALVTGASRGIGRALAKRLAAEGAAVVLCARSEQPIDGLPGSIHTVADEIAAAGGTAAPVRADVGNEADVRRAVGMAMHRFGRLDVLVNNASALWWQPILRTPPRRFEQMLRTNLWGTYLCLYHALPHIIASGGGHILTMTPPIVQEPAPGRGAYTSIKNAVARLALTVAREHRENAIASNTLWTHAYIETQATVNWRLGDPDGWLSTDVVADAVIEILAAPPPSLTGQNLFAEDVMRTAGLTDADFERYRARASD